MGKYEKTKPKKKGNTKFVISLPIFLILLAAVVAAVIWVVMNYHIVSGKFYSKDATFLDLRSEEIDTDNFEKIREKLPECDIRWNIPFQGGKIPDDTTEITITTLSETDIAQLDYARQLKTVNAEGCTDYEALELLRQRRPELEVIYSVTLSSGNFSWDVDTLVLNSISQEDIRHLEYLPNLKSVTLGVGSYVEHNVGLLRNYLTNAGLKFGVVIGSQILWDTDTLQEVNDITEEELELLDYLYVPQVKLVNPKVSWEAILSLKDRNPHAKISWQVSIGDLTFDETTTEVDLTMVEITDLAEVEQKLACLPNLTQVTFGLCGIDDPEWGNSKSELAASPIANEDMSAYRDRVRGDYKVVWTLRLGPSIALRSDADNFMPNHFRVGILPDSYAYNLRYCEEMVCLDVGHMTLTDISFVEFMPNLKYFILAWTEVQYIEPIRTCKNLVFLELDNSCIRDISPLVDCTALEDLNLGATYCDITPLKEMTWLKNVYMIRRHHAGVVALALPDTRVVGSDVPTAATVGYGWRKLPNYYAMRDCLNAPYMN